MAQYSIGEVEALTGLKAHILRYWEEIVPSVAPKKDFSGRRLYSQRDLDVVFRLKYLIYEKKFTIEGARDFIISNLDIANSNAELLQSIHELRNELTDLFFIIRKNRSKVTNETK